MWQWPLPFVAPPAWRDARAAPPSGRPALPPGALRALLPVLAASVAFRALPDVWREHPAGLDWGLYVAWAEQYAAGGLVPDRIPHYQLGLTRWLFFPGGPLVHAVPALLAGVAPSATLALTAVVGAVEAGGVFLLAWRLFARLDAALACALAAAVHPGSVEMAAWGGLGNLLGLALMPFAWLAFIELWEEGGARRSVAFALSASAVAVSHHLSAFWLAATLGLCLVPAALWRPRQVLARLGPAVPAVLLLCGPVIAHALDVVARVGGATFLFGGADRFAETRGFVAEAIASPGGALSIAVLVPGLAALAFLREVPLAAKGLVFAHLALAVALTFGGPLGLQFHHWRAMFYFGLLAQLATGALLLAFDRGPLRAWLAVGLLAGFAGTSAVTALRSGQTYRVASPEVEAAAAWLRAHSRPGDVVLTSNWLGFQLLRQVSLPMLVAVPPRDFFDADPRTARLAADALSALEGGGSAAELLRAHHVRFVVVRQQGLDVPDPARSRAWLAAEPGVRPVFSNRDVAIYGVLP